MQEAAVLAQMTLERLAAQAERLVADSFRVQRGGRRGRMRERISTAVRG